jgi:hypothetical protein
MSRHVFPSILAFALSLTPASAADTAPPAMPAAPGEAAFIADLQTAVAKKDETWLSGHVSFPMLWNKDAKTVHVKTPGQFDSRFEKMMTPELQSAVAAQKPAEAFRNWQGTMVGDGGRNIWFRQVGDTYRIVTINDDSRVPQTAKPE